MRCSFCGKEIGNYNFEKHACVRKRKKGFAYLPLESGKDLEGGVSTMVGYPKLWDGAGTPPAGIACCCRSLRCNREANTRFDGIRQKMAVKERIRGEGERKMVRALAAIDKAIKRGLLEKPGSGDLEKPI